jgi:hypothetical protein
MIIQQQETILSLIIDFALAPLQHPDITSSVMPLILGAVVIELYFGKHKQEVLGWNTSVGNAAIWISTGINLVVTETLESGLEQAVVYFILLTGLVVAYMDFFHKWKPAVAFRASTPDLIYPLSYVTVVMVKTDVAVTDTSIKAAIGFIIATVVGFRIPAVRNTSTRRFQQL